MVKEEARLNSLDAAIGDGDHGITMRTGFSAIAAKLTSLADSAGVDAVWRESGLAFMGATGGAIGVLLGKMLMAAGAGLKGREAIGAEEFRIVLSSMESALAATGKAQPGDKTILDAVHAANEALAAAPQRDLQFLLDAASRAATRGAEETAQMRARVGRASKLGDRALGHPDAGAVSFSIILKAMAEWFQKRSPPAA